MCKMNFWCSIAIVLIILIAALVLTNSFDVQVTRKHHDKSQQKLKDFRTEAFKAQKDIEILQSFARSQESHGNRQRRQAEDLFDNLSDEIDEEKIEETQAQPNRNSDVCKAESSKDSLKSSKELNNFLNTLRMEGKNMPREISLDESEMINNAANRLQNQEEEKKKSLREEKGAEQMVAKALNDRQKRLKLKGGIKNDLSYRWPERDREKNDFRAASNLKQSSNFIKESTEDTDLSSCQQCSQNKDKEDFSNNCKSQKETRPVNQARHGNIKFSQEPKKAETNRYFFNDFARKNNKKGQTDAAENDDDDDEDDKLNQIGKFILSPSQLKNEINQYEFKQTAVKGNSPLGSRRPTFNDQLEVTKNNLSHEADYKLSKDEQNAAENKKQTTWKWGIFKRSHPFNAMNEIKLKTSQRLMKKGFGASLPSYSLDETRRELFIDNELKQKEKEIFQNNNRKHYKHWHEIDNIENKFGEAENQLEDLAEMPLESELAQLPLNDWRKTRHKRISEINSRHKRELKLFNDQNALKAQVLRNKTLKLLPNNSENINTKAKASHKALNVKTYVKQNFVKAFKYKVLEYPKKAQKNEDKYEAHMLNGQNIDNQGLAKALSFQHNNTKELHTKSYLHSLSNISNLKLTQARSFLQNRTKAVKINHNFNNEKLLKRDKRSFLCPYSQFAMDQHKMNEQNSAVSSHKSVAGLLQPPFKILKRAKRFNPSQTINLKIYQKLHGAKVLKLKHKKPGKRRQRRALSSETCDKSSAGSISLIAKATNMIKNKTVQLRKNIENFFKKSLKYLTFQKTSRNKSENFKASLTESSIFKNNAVIKSKPTKHEAESDTSMRLKLNSSDRNLKLEDKSFKAKAVKRHHKTKNLKLGFLGVFLCRFYNSKPHLKSFRAKHSKESVKFSRKTRSVKDLINISGQNSRNSNRLRSSKTHDGFKKSSNNSSEQVQFSKYLFEKRNRSENGVSLVEAALISATNTSRPPKLLNKSDLIKNIPLENEKLDSINFESNFKNRFNQNLNLNESFNNKELNDKAFGNNNNNSRELNLNLNSKPTFSDKSIKIKAFKSSRKINVMRRSHGQSTNICRPKTKAHNTFQSPKRHKRSLKTTFPEDHRQPDAVHNLKKRDYFFPYGDFYNPDNRPDTSLELPLKSDINEENVQKLSTNEVLPVQQEATYENYYKNKFDDLKYYKPQTKKFDNLKYRNLWPEAEPQKGNFKQEKLILNTLDRKSSKSKSQKRNSALKNQKFLLKTTKLPLKVEILRDKYLKDLQNFNKNYKFSANNHHGPKNNSTLDYSEKLGLELHNEILNCKAFASLEDFIKSLPKNLTQPLLGGTSTTEKIDIDLNTFSINPEASTTMQPLILPSTENCSSKTEEEVVDKEKQETSERSEHVTQPSVLDLEQVSETELPSEETEETSLDPAEEDASTENITTVPKHQDHVKLNITIKAHVHGNPKEEQYCGNCSLSVTPALLDDRLKRDLKLSPLEKISKRFLRLRTPEADADEPEVLSDFISGKFSSKAVQNILTTVQANPQLKALWPSLDSRQKLSTSNQPNFYVLRSQQNEPQFRNAEKLLAQAMSAIDSIVEQQARARLCVPLRPDLQAFYNLIQNSRLQQDLVREKRQIKQYSKNQDFGDQLHLLDPNKIEEKTKIVKKLLKQYDELPKEDQQKVADVRDDLLKNLLVLRQLQEKEEWRANELREKREHDWAASDERALENLQSQYSLQFLKLLKAAELYREIKND